MAPNILYLGGPVDYATEHLSVDWRHWAAWAMDGKYLPYCPKCGCDDLLDPGTIITRNQNMLRQATIAVLDLRGHSIGTPIEMYWRLWVQGRSAILITRKERSIFIEHTVNNYPALVVSDPHQALVLLEKLSRG